MKRSIFFAMLVALIAAGAASGAEKGKADRASIIKSCDKNLDGRIDLQEYHLRLTEVFFFADADKDGNLTFVEIQAFVPTAKPEKFKAADSNKDGKLSVGEYHNALGKDFDAADKNEDGHLDAEEVDGMMESS